MDAETLDGLFSGFIPALAYDLVKIVAGYIIARIIYEGVFKQWRYGGWTLVVTRDGADLTRRSLSPQLAESVTRNDNDLSVYVKGVVSFHDWLNMDICSPEARARGLLRVDRNARTITVDLDKNPPGRKPHHPANEGPPTVPATGPET
jgi:hypothetical protein